MSMLWAPAAAPEDAAENIPRHGVGELQTPPMLPSVTMQLLKILQKDWMATQTKSHGRIPTRVLACAISTDFSDVQEA